MENSPTNSVLLVIGGGVAAYKTHELVRLLVKAGLAVRIILTRSAEQFVTPLSLGSLSGSKVYSNLFDLTEEVEMGHIQLSRSADLVVVAPATADLLGKMANGLADDLASTALMATDKPVLVAPAMNHRMWLHPATQRNIGQLRHDGIAVIGPNDGEMACGEFGPGRMAEPSEILAAIQSLMVPRSRPLAGRKVLVTAGPTREPIDPVRYISNNSSGKQGYAIAEVAASLGATTVLVSGPVALSAAAGVQVRPVQTASEMLGCCLEELPCDIAIFAAAVADWRVASIAKEKVKKGAAGPPSLALAENPDILRTVAQHSRLRPNIVVGFAAETENVIEHARQKLVAKGCDIIIANDVGAASAVFGSDYNRVHVVTATGIESWKEMSKRDVARRLMEHLVHALSPKDAS